MSQAPPAPSTFSRLASVRARLGLLLGALLLTLLAGLGLVWTASREDDRARAYSESVRQSTADLALVYTAQTAFTQGRRALADLRDDAQAEARTAPPNESAAARANRQNRLRLNASARVAEWLQARAGLSRLDPALARRMDRHVESLAGLVVMAQAPAATDRARAADGLARFPAAAQTDADDLASLGLDSRRQLDRLTREGNRYRAVSPALLGLAMLALLALLGWLAWMTWRSVVAPLAMVAADADRLAAGEAVPLRDYAEHNEFGRIARAFARTAELSRRLKREAWRDPLTGLANRASFERTLATLTRDPAQPCGLLLVGLDHFRTINEALGHELGDQCLRYSAARLGQLAGENPEVTEALALRGDADPGPRSGPDPADGRLPSPLERMLAFRYSADLFAVIVDNPVTASPLALANLAERVRQTIARPFRLEEHMLALTASVGVAVFPEHATNQEMLVSAADAALHSAKKQGRDRVAIVDATFRERAQRHLELGEELRLALHNGDLLCHYQPVVDVRTHRVVAAEALIRWRQGATLRLPGSFLPTLEEIHLLGRTTNALLAQACRDAVRWQAMGVGARLAYNLSPALFHPGIVHELSAIIEDSGLPPTRLEFEITENAVFGQPDLARGLLEELARLGITLSLDDFGTGFSSLSLLQRFPIAKIKIDQSFVLALPGHSAQQIIKATAGLARSLDLELVAEGVENELQSRMLADMGCYRQQGFLYTPALARDAFIEWVRRYEAEHAERPAGESPAPGPGTPDALPLASAPA